MICGTFDFQHECLIEICQIYVKYFLNIFFMASRRMVN